MCVETLSMGIGCAIPTVTDYATCLLGIDIDYSIIFLILLESLILYPSPFTIT